ncbi:hypothetical protein SHI21_19550 [Bacteriovorax sp. PP10]|uniref:Peptidase C39-like domain-containing protein n=1 Tax=Bacteriovorax antarcticus TaxID=3088717 RepID=A0ABU5VZL4_9BACT|nr:hypothetical protein [Bacteriovorax sp. PP10]MEA9358441.1 hypothetical protein [Bacteriovorax sp. PP10]
MPKALLLLFAIMMTALPCTSFSQEFQKIILENKENIRYLKNNILEIAAELPKGTLIQFLKDNQNVFYDYRDSKGVVQRSSTGFFSGVTIISVTPENVNSFPESRIKKLNATIDGLFITKSLQEANNQEFFQALIPGALNADYLSIFTESGKAKYSYTNYFTKRFGNRLNHILTDDEISSRDRVKWSAVYEELKRAASREDKTPTDYLFTTVDLANKHTTLFEQTGETQPKGAWTMAVKSTAVRHGFPNVPCAEFMSEMIRQAYMRSGYDFTEDFNNSKDNYLIWNKTAAVVNLANSLHKAEWIPWELSKFSPPTGAIMMHEQATSPGHTYMIAGDNGRFVVDNGSPAGRDLRKTAKKTIEIMFKGGVFFLPPGITPRAW